MTGSRRAVFGLSILLATARPLRCQEPASGPTRADSAAVVLDVARQARAQGRRDVAVYLFRTVVERFPGTPAADTAAQESGVVEKAQRRQSGSATLAAWGALYGAWLGVAVPVALGAEDPSPIGAGILAGIPIGLFAGRGYARDAGLSGGQARAIAFASIFGTFQAMGWRDVFGIGDHRQTICGTFGCFESQQQSDRAPIAAAILGGLAGIATTAALAHSREMSSGTIAAAEWGSLWGAWFGAASAGVVNVQGEHSALTWSLSGSAVALVVTATQAHRWNLTASRPWLVSAAGIAGMVTGLGADLLFQIDDEQTALLFPLAGSVAGLAVGVHATRPRGDAGLGLREAESGALIEWNNGAVGFGTPRPMPLNTRLASRLGGAALGRGVGIPLLALRLP